MLKSSACECVMISKLSSLVLEKTKHCQINLNSPQNDRSLQVMEPEGGLKTFSVLSF